LNINKIHKPPLPKKFSSASKALNIINLQIKAYDITIRFKMSKIFLLTFLVSIVAADVSWLGTWRILSSYSTNMTYCPYPDYNTNATSSISGSGFNISFLSTRKEQTTVYFPWDPYDRNSNASLPGWVEEGKLNISGDKVVASVFLNHTDYAVSFCGWVMFRYINSSTVQSASS